MRRNKRTSHSSIEQAVNDIQKGKLIEKKAMEFLNNSNKYSDVRDVSAMGLGYDIECKDTSRTFYIEVKSFEKDYFELTENEYNSWQKNKKIYKIFLIKLNSASNTIYEKLIDGEDLENFFDIQISRYKCKCKCK